MEPLKLYLGDLTHDTIVLVSDTIPINVGFVGSYAKKIYGDDIDVSLFKYPGSLIDAIKSDPPDVLALSNYSWNSHLSERVAGLTKQVNPSAVTVQGGTNFPHLASQHLDFLSKRPNTDFHVEIGAGRLAGGDFEPRAAVALEPLDFGRQIVDAVGQEQENVGPSGVDRGGEPLAGRGVDEPNRSIRNERAVWVTNGASERGRALAESGGHGQRQQ